MKNGTTTTFGVSGQFSPVGHQWRFFHVNVEHGRIFSERADFFRFAFCRYGAVFVQIRSVRDDQQAGLGRIDIGRDFVRALAEADRSSMDDSLTGSQYFQIWPFERLVIRPFNSSSRGTTVCVK